ncbi:MAG: hypothetical protein ACRDRN_20705 [Sciscionella sp.]
MAADSGQRARRAAAINAVISASEYRYGIERRRGGVHPDGGTSLAGSSACSQRANPRTTDRRIASRPGDAVAGAVTHAIASSLVTRVAPVRSQTVTRRAFPVTSVEAKPGFNHNDFYHGSCSARSHPIASGHWTSAAARLPLPA